MTDLDWISFRAAQNFPLADEVTGMSTSSNILQKSLLLDIRIIIPPGADVDKSNFYISRILSNISSLYVYIAYNGTDVAFCGGIPKTLGMSEPVSQRYFNISAVQTDYSWSKNLMGSICFGATEQYTDGDQYFTSATAKLNPMCFQQFAFQCLQGIQVQDQVYTGIVQLNFKDGIQVEARQTETGAVIDVSIDLDYLKQQLILDTVTEQIGTPVLTINGVSPDASGNINLRGLDCVALNSAGDGVITISNTCAKPCCDSTYASSTQSTLAAIQEAQNVLQTYFVNQLNTINYMQANLSTLMSSR